MKIVNDPIAANIKLSCTLPLHDPCAFDFFVPYTFLFGIEFFWDSIGCFFLRSEIFSRGFSLLLMYSIVAHTGHLVCIFWPFC